MPTKPLAATSTGSTIPSGAIPRSTSPARLSSKNMPPNEPMPLHQHEASPEEHLRGLVEGGAHHRIAALRNPSVIVPLAGLEAARCQAEMRPHRLGAGKALRLVHRRPESQRHNRSNPRHRHQPTAQLGAANLVENHFVQL